MVDPPLVTDGSTLWMWASAEIGDEYVWVGEEAVIILRTAEDDAFLDHTLELNQIREPLVAGYG